MMEQVFSQDVVITNVTFTMETLEISYLVNKEQTDAASMARVLEIRMDSDELIEAYLDLQDMLGRIVLEGEVIIRNPPVRQGGGLETLYRQKMIDESEQ